MLRRILAGLAVGALALTVLISTPAAASRASDRADQTRTWVKAMPPGEKIGLVAYVNRWDAARAVAVLSARDPVFRFVFAAWTHAVLHPPAPPGHPQHTHPFLVCTRGHESAVGYPYPNDQNYDVVSASGTYRGAYQFARSTWDNTARRLGRFDLVGVDPAAASPYDQDDLAWALYQWQGNSPWGGRC